MSFTKKAKNLFWLLAFLPTTALAKASTGTFNTVFGVSCDGYDCWISAAWRWSLMVIIPVSVVMLSAAGVVYMTSAGDKDRIELAKKLIKGVAYGLGLLILARVLLVNIIGLDSAWNV